MHLEEVEAIKTVAPVFAPLEELLPNFRTGPLKRPCSLFSGLKSLPGPDPCCSFLVEADVHYSLHCAVMIPGIPLFLGVEHLLYTMSV